MDDLSETGDLAEGVQDALVGDADPERIEAFGFARGILPLYDLMRGLFGQSRVDTCLKLMILFELARSPGRKPMATIRSLCGFLPEERVDALVKTLRERGWLELRAADQSYQPSEAGRHLLAVLHGASPDTLDSTNTLSRAAQVAEFSAGLDGAEDTTPYLLEQLLALLDGLVEEAEATLRRGRPFQLIAWSRREHGRQLETIRQVLGRLQERMEGTSRHFTRITRLHQAMQRIVGQHRAVHVRLREWNVERLWTQEAGYSIDELVEAVLGASEEDLRTATRERLFQRRALPPTLTTEEVRSRFAGARRKVRGQREAFTYAPPAEPEPESLDPAAIDPSSRLRERLTEILAGRSDEDPPLELEEWLEARRFEEDAWDMALLSRLQGGEPAPHLDDGRLLQVRHLEELRSLAPGRYARLLLAAASGEQSDEGAT